MGQKNDEAREPQANVAGQSPRPIPPPITPIKMPNPPDEVQPEVVKISSRDAPGG